MKVISKHTFVFNLWYDKYRNFIVLFLSLLQHFFLLLERFWGDMAYSCISIDWIRLFAPIEVEVEL